MTKIVAVGGLSEAGKSTVGYRFIEHGFLRLKIAKYYREFYELENRELDFLTWSKNIDRQRPMEIATFLKKRIIEDCSAKSAKGCALESLYGDVLATSLRELHGSNFTALFISSKESLRWKRQEHKDKFGTSADALDDLRQRDALKVSWGALYTEEIADQVIFNNGTYDEYVAKIDDFINKLQK